MNNKIKKIIAFEWLIFLSFGIGGALATFLLAIVLYNIAPTARVCEIYFSSTLALAYPYLLYLSVRLTQMLIISIKWAINIVKAK